MDHFVHSFLFVSCKPCLHHNYYWRYSVSTNFRLEYIEASAREVFIFWYEREKRGGEEKRTWLKPCETQNSAKAKKTCWPSNSLADGSISSRRKLVDTLLYRIKDAHLTQGRFVLSGRNYKERKKVVQNALNDAALLQGWLAWRG